MSGETQTTDAAQTEIRRSLYRWSLALLGLICVGLAALGAVLPGMPTTIFLIAACYLFAKSCPRLEQIFVRNRFFGPFLPYLDGTAQMPMKARITTLLVMWSFITFSTLILIFRNDVAVAIAMLIPAAGLVGSYFILRGTRIRRANYALRDDVR
jgi:uncharacterized membrane protein YbaN (DUF454 family)